MLTLAFLVMTQTAPVKPVVYDMDADLIEGVRLEAPEHVVRTRPKFEHKSLIQLRKGFSQELLASVTKI